MATLEPLKARPRACIGPQGTFQEPFWSGRRSWLTSREYWSLFPGLGRGPEQVLSAGCFLRYLVNTELFMVMQHTDKKRHENTVLDDYNG